MVFIPILRDSEKRTNKQYSEFTNRRPEKKCFVSFREFKMFLSCSFGNVNFFVRVKNENEFFSILPMNSIASLVPWKGKKEEKNSRKNKKFDQNGKSEIYFQAAVGFHKNFPLKKGLILRKKCFWSICSWNGIPRWLSFSMKTRDRVDDGPFSCSDVPHSFHR